MTIEGFSWIGPASCAHVTMLSAGAVLAIACAIAAAVDLKHDLLNNTDIDKRVLKRLTAFLESNKTLDQRDIALLNRTAHNLDLEAELVTKLTELVKQRTNVGNVSNANTTISDVRVITTAKPVIEDKGKRETKHAVEESPDYASSVVLASDLLALTTSVGKVKDKVCREQGYRFLDGLLLNKRWALKSKFLYYNKQKLQLCAETFFTHIFNSNEIILNHLRHLTNIVTLLVKLKTD